MSCHYCHNQHAQHQKTVIIRNPKSGYVLDASDYHVKLQPYCGSFAQLWTLECIDFGRFLIRNKSNGNVLDIQGGAKSMARLITYNQHGGENQQWFINSDGTIVNSAGVLAVDISEGMYHTGNNIVAYPKHGQENQIFQLQYC